MRPNIVDVQLGFYGVADFQSNSEFPKPAHIGEWMKRHYTCTLCDSPFGKYQIDMTMVAGNGLIDRMAFDVLLVDYGSTPPSATQAAHSFRRNTHLQSRFEIFMDDLMAEKSGWKYYQSQRNLGIDYMALGYEREAERLFDYAGIVKQDLVAELENELQSHNIKMVVESHPRLSSMLIDVFADYKDATFDLNRIAEPHPKLVKNS